MKYGELTLGQIEALVNKVGGMEGVQRILTDATEVVVKAATKLLELVTTVETTGIKAFKAGGKFREGKTTDGVKIAWLSDNFKENFLGKTEQNVAQAAFRIQKLKKASLDELGDTAEIFLAQLWELLKKQGNGQRGDLLVSGYANITYIRDSSGNLWAVCAHWRADHDGWHVNADSVTDPSLWYADNQVVSR